MNILRFSALMLPMKRGVLANTIYSYRIADADAPFPLCEDEASCKDPGRWNTSTTPVLYTSEHYSTALLEQLALYGQDLPANLYFTRLTIPGGVSCEEFDPAAHPGWDAPDRKIAREFGSAWQKEKRSLVLIVPSIVGEGERNILLNLRHPEAIRLSRDEEKRILWNDRLQNLTASVSHLQRELA